MVLIVTFFSGLLLWWWSTPLLGFVLITGPEEARLDVTTATPTIHFEVSNEFPDIYNKHLFQDGAYQDLEDEEFYLRLLETAFNTWANVSTSYIEFTYEISDTATIDKSDSIHTIAIGDVNRVASASALPLYEDGIIYDCDISLSNRRTSARALAYTLIHEIGHCLGLGHNHSDPGAIMGYRRTDLTLKLGADDIAGVTYLYPNEGLDPPKELISCGSIGLSTAPNLAIWALLAPLTLLSLRKKPNSPTRKNLHTK